MKKLLMILVMSLISINPILGEDTFPSFSFSSLDKNIFKYNWKVDKIRSTNDKDIYYLKKNNRLLQCMVTLKNYDIETYCAAP
jgi:hypothetical protein